MRTALFIFINFTQKTMFKKIFSSFILMNYALSPIIFAQTIKFQYDAKGNQISAKYTGNNPCPTAPAPGVEGLQVGNEAATLSDVPANLRESRQIVRSNAGQVSVFPNPSSDGSFNVNFTLAQESPVEISVVNMNGQLVYSSKVGTVQAGTVPVSLQHQPPGLYLLKLTAAGFTSTVQLCLQ